MVWGMGGEYGVRMVGGVGRMGVWGGWWLMEGGGGGVGRGEGKVGEVVDEGGVWELWGVEGRFLV